jgi:PST family polysaccharide transporter
MAATVSGERRFPSEPPSAVYANARGAAPMAVAPACGDVLPAVGRPGLLLPIQIPSVVLAIAGFVAVADAGLTAVAGVHLAYGIAFAFVHVVVAMRVLGATGGEFLAALRPGLVAAVGITAAALPVRLAIEPGLPALLLTVAAGSAGGVAALALASRSTFADVRVTLGQALGR